MTQPVPTFTLIASILPTEMVEKVETVFNNLFPESDNRLTKSDSKISYQPSIEEMNAFTLLLEKIRILDAARKQILSSIQDSFDENGHITGQCAVLHLNKQAAYIGKINILSEEFMMTPLHDLQLVLSTSGDLMPIIDIYFPQWATLKRQRSLIKNNIKNSTI